MSFLLIELETKIDCRVLKRSAASIPSQKNPLKLSIATFPTILRKIKNIPSIYYSVKTSRQKDEHF